MANVQDAEMRHKAATLIARRGRAYATNRGRSVTLHVFSTDQGDMRLLEDVYGGAYRRHSSGFQWTIMRATSLEDVLVDLLPYSRSESRKRLQALYTAHEPAVLARLNLQLGNQTLVAA